MTKRELKYKVNKRMLIINIIRSIILITLFLFSLLTTIFTKNYEWSLLFLVVIYLGDSWFTRISQNKLEENCYKYYERIDNYSS